nr:hypothetical protein [Tanacetum cinerariifolium]
NQQFEKYFMPSEALAGGFITQFEKYFMPSEALAGGFITQFEKYFVFTFLLPMLCVNMSVGFFVDGQNRFLGQSP